MLKNLQNFFAIFALIFSACLPAKVSTPPIASSDQSSIPIHPTKESIFDLVTLAGNIEPLQSADIKTGWNTVISSIKIHVGDIVKKDAILAVVDTNSVQYFQNYYLLFKQQLLETDASNRKQYGFLQKRLKNLEILVKKGTIANKMVDDVERQAIEFQKSFLSTTQEIKSIDSQIAELKHQAAVTQITAPIAGKISRLVVDPEQIVGAFTIDPGAVFASILVPGAFKVKAFAYDFQIGNLKEGLPCTISWGDFSQKVTGEISSIDKFVEKKQSDYDNIPKESVGQFVVWATFKYTDMTIPIGSFAKLSFKLNHRENALTIPWNAVKVTSRGNLVSVVDPANGQIERPVILGSSFGSRVEILRGLRASDIVMARFY